MEGGSEVAQAVVPTQPRPTNLALERVAAAGIQGGATQATVLPAVLAGCPSGTHGHAQAILQAHPEVLVRHGGWCFVLERLRGLQEATGARTPAGAQVNLVINRETVKQRIFATSAQLGGL